MPAICDVIIPVHDQLDNLKLCVESLFENTKTEFKLIIIDDASGPLTRDYINSLNGVQLIRFENNAGFVNAVNAGLARSDAKYACLLNSDTIAGQGWLERMIEVAQANPRIGLLNPNSSTFHVYPKKPDLKHINILSAYLSRYKGLYQEMTNCVGFCMLIKREVLNKIGNLSRDYGLGYYEDLDFSRKAAEAGFMSAMVIPSYVYHFEKKTFSKINSRENIIKENKAFFENKWGKSLRVMFAAPSLTDDVMRVCLELSRNWNLVYLYTFSWKLLKNMISRDYSPHQNLRIRLVWPVNLIALVKAVKRAFSPKKVYDAAIFSSLFSAWVMHIILPKLPIFHLNNKGQLCPLFVNKSKRPQLTLENLLGIKNG